MKLGGAGFPWAGGGGDTHTHTFRAEKSLLFLHSRIRELLHSAQKQWARVQERNQQRREQLLASLRWHVSSQVAGEIRRSGGPGAHSCAEPVGSCLLSFPYLEAQFLGVSKRRLELCSLLLREGCLD